MDNSTLLEKNMRQLLRLQLALESYEDDNNENNLLLIETNKDLGKFRKEINNLNIEEQISISTKIINNYEEVLNIVGRDNFIFYEDGDINYIWKDRSSNNE